MHDLSNKNHKRKVGVHFIKLQAEIHMEEQRSFKCMILWERDSNIKVEKFSVLNFLWMIFVQQNLVVKRIIFPKRLGTVEAGVGAETIQPLFFI